MQLDIVRDVMLKSCARPAVLPPIMLRCASVQYCMYENPMNRDVCMDGSTKEQRSMVHLWQYSGNVGMVTRNNVYKLSS